MNKSDSVESLDRCILIARIMMASNKEIAVSITWRRNDVLALNLILTGNPICPYFTLWRLVSNISLSEYARRIESMAPAATARVSSHSATMRASVGAGEELRGGDVCGATGDGAVVTVRTVKVCGHALFLRPVRAGPRRFFLAATGAGGEF